MGHEPSFRFSGPAELNLRLTEAVEVLRRETQRTGNLLVWLTIALVALTAALVVATIVLPLTCE
jgi:hypothetical protein